MPKPNFTQAEITRYQVSHVPLDRGGYTKSGQYFGAGPKLFEVFDQDEGRSVMVRAPDAKTARYRAMTNASHWGGWQ